MPPQTEHEASMVQYFAGLLAEAAEMSIPEAVEAVDETILAELRTSGQRGLHLINLPMGMMMVGKAYAPNDHIAGYVRSIQNRDTERWAREGVTESDIVAWWDLGGVTHGCFVAYDNLFNVARVTDVMQRQAGFDTIEELVEYAKKSLVKGFALFGPDDGDHTDGRLPFELRFRVDEWLRRMRRFMPDELAASRTTSGSFNSLIRGLVRKGVI